MASFPTLAVSSRKVVSPLSAQPLATWPTTQSTTYGTRVLRFLGDQEQRWPVRQKLFEATIEYGGVNGYDASLVFDFFISMRGKYVDTAMLNVFDITIDGVTYDWCVFDQDTLEITDDPSKLGTFKFTIKIRQLRKN